MAQELNIPGLKEAIADFEKLHLTVQTNAKSLLDMAINAEKAVKAVGGDGIKAFTETTKTAKAETDKLEQAKERLTKSETEQAKQLAVVTLAIQKQNAANKEYAKSQDESRTSLEKFNAKILESTRASKELGAQMVLMALEGKKNTAEYKNLETQFIKAAETSKKLNDSYREISKTAGDNRALVGSYSSELKGHFDIINGSISSLKGNMASGNWSGAFSDARNTVIGFGSYLKKATEASKDFGGEMKNNGGVFSSLKTKMSDAGTTLVNFFKPAEQNSAKMSEGLDRIMIGFKRNSVAIAETTTAQTASNIAGEVANNTAKSGTIFTNLWAGAQLLFAGATGVATGAVAVLGVAFAALGIGLIIAAVALLAEGLSNFRPLMNFLKDGLAGVGAVVEMLSDKITQFVVNIKSVGDLLSKLGDIMLHPIDTVKKMGSEMAETAKKGAELNEQTRKLTASQKDYAIESKNVENQIKALMLQARNRTTSEEDRIKLLKRAQELEETMHNKKLGMWQQEMDLNLEKLKNEGKITDAEIALLRKGDQAALDSLKKKGQISSAELDTFREIMTKKADVDAEGIAVREKSTNMIDSLDEKSQKKKEDTTKKSEELAKKQLDSQKKTAEEGIKTMKITLDNEIATYDQTTKLQNENIAHIQAISVMKQSIASAELSKNLIGVKKGSQDEIIIRNGFNQELVKIETEKNKALEKVRLDGSKFEIEVYDLTNKTLIEDGAQLTDLLVNEEKKRIAKTLEVHRLGLREELNIDKNLSDEKLKEMSKTTGLLTAAQLKYLQGLEKLEETKAKETKKVDADLLASKVKDINEEVKREEAKFKLLNKGKLADINNSFKLKQAALNKELALEQTTAKRKLEIAKELADNEMNIARIKDEMVIAGRDRALNNLIEVSGKESVIGKIAGIAQIEIATQKAVMEGWADGMAYGGPAAPYLAALYAGLAGAAGLESIGKVMGISAFATGTDSAPYTGIAMIDEKGAEIHTDKFGNIKSMGSDGGAHLTNIVKGDKIIPADISTMLKQSMALNFKHKDVIDYAEMGRYFDKSLTKVVNAVNNKREASLSVSVQKGISDRVIFKGRNV